MSKSFYQTTEWLNLARHTRNRWIQERKPCAFCNGPLHRRDHCIVDHMIPRRVRPELSLVASNLVVMHHKCHSQKTRWVDHNTRPTINEAGLPPAWQ